MKQNQKESRDFFRSAVLASYHSVCCITGISSPKLLIASHIKPWKDSTPQERTDPQNGLCLNALHDRAFDQGLLTVTPDYVVHVSEVLRTEYFGEMGKQIFLIILGDMKIRRSCFPIDNVPSANILIIIITRFLRVNTDTV